MARNRTCDRCGAQLPPRARSCKACKGAAPAGAERLSVRTRRGREILASALLAPAPASGLDLVRGFGAVELIVDAEPNAPEKDSEP